MRAIRAWRAHEHGAPIAIERIACPVPAAGEVAVRVHAAALNFSDTLMLGGRYQIRPPLPFTPGQEIAGVVLAVGPEVDVAIGTRVATKVLWGGFAEVALARRDMLIEVPPELALTDAATLPVVWPTAWIALHDRARLAAGETLLVHAAAGGVGLAAVALGHAAGARVIAGIGDAAKADACRAAGAGDVVLTTASDWPDAVSRITRAVDVVFDPVGGDITDPSVRLLARGGRLLIVGFAAGRIPEIKANRLLLKNASALGVYWSHDDDGALVQRAVAAILALARAGKIRLAASRVYTFEALPQALEDLAHRRTVGKSVIVVSEQT